MPPAAPTPRAPRTALATAAFAACGLAFAALATLAVLLSVRKTFSIDEFQYAHAAWLFARGQVPYRDFFDVHFPLLYQAQSLLFLALGDDPRGVLALRLSMLAPLTASVAAVSALNRPDPIARVLAPVFLLATATFTIFAVEIRPDPAAGALLLAALALGLPEPRSRARLIASGALSACAVLVSQKAGLFGAVVLAVPAAEVLRRRRGEPARPWAFFAGALPFAAAFAAYLTATGTWGLAYEYCFRYHRHQAHTGFPFTRYLVPLLWAHAWLVALALVGAARAAREGLAGRVLVAAAALALVAFCLQRAAFPYSLVPFLGFAAALAARGASAIFAALAARPLKIFFALALVAAGALESTRMVGRIVDSNTRQLEVLATVGRLAAPEDPVYDNVGGAVTRPSVHYFYYTDASLRVLEARRLETEIPRALVDRGCTIWLFDLRVESLPAGLKRFLGDHYQPLDGDVRLWGQRLEAETEFLAPRAGRYFVHPPEAAGSVTVDGAPSAGPEFSLEKGAHAVRYGGSQPAWMLWLPPDGRRWRPDFASEPTFSRLF